MAAKGFDFSHYQGTINWPAVKASGIQFAYGKVIEGTSAADAQWPANRAGALAVGIPVGGYYWAHPNLDPIACANAFLPRLNQVPGMLQPIVDMEHNGSANGPSGGGGRTPKQIHDWLHTFRAVVQAKGYRLDTYTGTWWWNPFVAPAAAGCAECAASRLYLSRYASSMGAVPKPWTYASAWQWTETGTVPGVPSSGEDEDVLVGTEQMSDLIYSSTTHPTQPTEDEFMGFIDNQDEFNAALKTGLTAYFKAAAGTPDLGVRATLDSYFDSRIPDPAHSTPGSISERLANRLDAVLGDPKDETSLYCKLVRALGKDA